VPDVSEDDKDRPGEYSEDGRRFIRLFPGEEERLAARLLAAMRTCPLADTKKTSLPSQSVTGFASRLTAMLPRTPIISPGGRGAVLRHRCADTPVLAHAVGTSFDRRTKVRIMLRQR
jgi:hypothetical protein